MKAILDLPEQHTKVLSFLIKTISPPEDLWALTGSAALRLQGVDIPVNDLDVQTDDRLVFLLEERFAGFMKVPVHLWETEHTVSYHGQAEIQGLQVELLGDVRHRLPDGTWTPPPDVESLRVWVSWNHLMIPVLPLAHEALAYEKMGRIQKAELIRSVIRKGS